MSNFRGCTCCQRGSKEGEQSCEGISRAGSSGQRLDTDRRDVLLLELASHVTLDEGGLADTTVTDEEALELGDFSLRAKRRIDRASGAQAAEQKVGWVNEDP